MGGARESRTRAAAKHSGASHPRRGNGGATGCYGDNNGESRSEAETSVQSARWQRVEQPEQPQHSHRDADQRDEPARRQRPLAGASSEQTVARCCKSLEVRTQEDIWYLCDVEPPTSPLTPGSELEFKWKIMTPSPYVDYYYI